MESYLFTNLIDEELFDLDAGANAYAGDGGGSGYSIVAAKVTAWDVFTLYRLAVYIVDSAGSFIEGCQDGWERR